MLHTNQLIHESSPYLLQHAHNPVNWLPFGDEAFAIALRENKPVIISIGYSSCHWCHVMEHESFENEKIADLMNTHFVCVKVDREERPDVDHAFMDAVQMIHGNGGWPLNCFALPDGRPFWGGTYFRPEQWEQLLNNVVELYQNRYQDIEKQAIEIADGVTRQNFLLNEMTGIVAPDYDLGKAFSTLYNAFDKEKGGMQGAPKFPLPSVLMFLLQFAASRHNESALGIVELTLTNMVRGGIYDQAGGGFARYSTDSDWKVPHFEKMLYDNAQLISVYSAAFAATGNSMYKECIEQTIRFINRELTAPEGIFYSALDADSEGEEGLFYTWTSAEFSDALGHYAPLAAEYFGIDKQGLWENGRNILLRPEGDEFFAPRHFLSVDELKSLTAYCRSELLKVRSRRPAPGLDDKMVVAWNSQMISALVDAFVVVGDEQYLQNAITAAHFILNNLKRKQSGLFHTWKAGKSHIHAFLDDYAFTIEAFTKLYSITTDALWLEQAVELTEYVNKHFYDSATGFFWYSENEDKQVFARKIEIYDGVIPSGNSVMATVLHLLGTFLHKTEYFEKSRQMTQSMKNHIDRSPAAYSKWATLVLSNPENPKVIAVVGENAVAVIQKLLSANKKGAMVFGCKYESKLPYFEHRYIAGKTLIYICSGTHCLAPVENVEEALNLLVN